MKPMVLCLTSLLISLPALSKTYHFDQRLKFGTIDHELRKTVNAETDRFLEMATISYLANCKIFKRDLYQTTKATFGCNFDVTKFSNGHKQTLIEGEMLKLPTNNINGFSVKLEAPIRYSATIEPVRKPYWLDTLDYKRTISTHEKRNIFRNIFVKYAPYNHSAWTNICSELPGIAIDTKLSKVKVFAQKKIFLFLKAKASIEIDASLGSYWNQSARICGGAKLGYDKERAIASLSKRSLTASIVEPQFYLKDPTVSPIHYKGLKVNKIHVRGRNLFTKIVFFLFSKIKNRIIEDIRKDLNKKLTGEVKKHLSNTNHELSSGHLWRKLAKLQGLDTHVQLVTSLNKPMVQTVKEGYSKNLEIPASEIESFCGQIYSQLTNKYGVKVSNRICSRMISKVSVLPFFRDPVLVEKGCYQFHHLVYNYNSFTHRDENLWWRSQCQLKARLSITVRPEVEQAFECMTLMQKKKVDIDQVVQKCSPLILANQFGIDPRQALDLLESSNLDDFFNDVILDKRTQDRIRREVKLL